MARTRKNGSKLPEYAATFRGLHHWYDAKFEKLGWMVLAKAKGHTEKVTAYKTGINRLLKSIAHVSSEYQDPDRKHDLAVLHMNTLELKHFVEKTL